MLFIVTLFAAITKTRFSGLKWSSTTILFHIYRKFDVNLPKTPSFCKKNASFIENNLPFVGIMFLSRKEAKGSSFRCLAIPVSYLSQMVCLQVQKRTQLIARVPSISIESRTHTSGHGQD